MDAQDFFSQILERQSETDALVNDFYRATCDFAEAQAIYDIEVANHTVNHKQKGTPATLIKDIIRGEVADARKTMVIAEGAMKAADKRELNNRKMLTLLSAAVDKGWETV